MREYVNPQVCGGVTLGRGGRFQDMNLEYLTYQVVVSREGIL